MYYTIRVILYCRVQRIWLFFKKMNNTDPFFNQKMCQNTQNFTLISNLLKKLLKMHQKKLYAKQVWQTWVKVKKRHISVTFLLVTFFGCIFSNLFQRIRNQREILRFLIPILNFFRRQPNILHTYINDLCTISKN